LGTGKTATETFLHDVRTSKYYLTYVDKEGMQTPNLKTDVIISIGITWGKRQGSKCPPNVFPTYEYLFLATELKRCKFKKMACE
jgi:hypothetical protein